jgi:hypothetical protein
MRVQHGVTSVFDDPKPRVVRRSRARRTGRAHDLVAEHVRLDRPGGQHALLKVVSRIAGIVAGADSIDDMTLLRAAIPRRHNT